MLVLLAVLGIRDNLVRDPDPHLWLMDPDLAPDPPPFLSDFKDAKKIQFFSYNLPAGTTSSVKKKILLKFCV